MNALADATPTDPVSRALLPADPDMQTYTIYTARLAAGKGRLVLCAVHAQAEERLREEIARGIKLLRLDRLIYRTRNRALARLVADLEYA